MVETKLEMEVEAFQRQAVDPMAQDSCLQAGQGNTMQGFRAN
jgi:hypothetical protein